jgi:hypothetical protein
MTTISEAMGELPITITPVQIHDVEKMVVSFFLRRTHPLTFDGPYLGVHPVSFTTADYNALFDIFDLRKAEVEEKIRTMHAVDRNFVVTSEPYNILIMWLVHLAPIYIKDKKVCYQFQRNCILLFLCRIFTSTVNNSWKHGANEGVVTATVANLSRKSDIIRLGSWRALIESHAEKILDPQDRFYKTLVDGSPDDMFLRVIGESQTALRAKIVTFAQAYYEAYKEGDRIDSKSSISENKEGERIIAQTASVIDSATQAMVSEILNPNMFVHDISVDDIAGMFTTISPRMLKTALLKLNETAVLQTSSRTFDKVQIDKEGTLYIGMRALIIEIIRSMIRLCRERRINMGQRAIVFEKMRDAYSSSRSTDPDIAAIKRSVTYLTDSFNITVNVASQSALRLAVIYYVLYRCLQRMK